jgi:VWFA-related protein
MLRILFLLLLAQDQSTFHSDVTLVHVDVEVREDNRGITGLEKGSFRVTDDGKLQTIAYFAQQEAPIDLILLFDARAEMRHAAQQAAGAAHAVLGDLRAGDRIAVIAFGAAGGNCRTDIVCDLTSDFAAAAQSIGNQVLQRDFSSKTSLCQPIRGLEAAAQDFLRHPAGNRRRAIIAVSDDQGASTRPGSVRPGIRDLWDADAVVLGVIIPGSASGFGIGPPYRGARYAASQTGGGTLETADAADGIHEMIRRLRQRYSLYYALPLGKPKQEHKIRVHLTSAAAQRYPHAIIRARTGYAMPGDRQ